MDHVIVFAKFNTEYFTPKGAQLIYDGQSGSGDGAFGKFRIIDKNGQVQSEEFESTLDEEELGYLMEALSSQLD